MYVLQKFVYIRFFQVLVVISTVVVAATAAADVATGAVEEEMKINPPYQRIRTSLNAITATTNDNDDGGTIAKPMYLTTESTDSKPARQQSVRSMIETTNNHYQQQQQHRMLSNTTAAPSSTEAPSTTPPSTVPPIDWEYENIVALRWKIQPSPDITYSGIQIDLHFTVSDYVVESMVRYQLYEGSSCGYVGEIITSSYITSSVVPDNTPTGSGLSTRTMTVENRLVPDNIINSNSYVESGTDAQISYCVRFELWDGPESDPEASRINHQDVLVSLVLDLSDDFTISGQSVVARDRIVETSDDEFFVEAFLCEEDTGQPPQDTVPILQGQSVRVCVQPTTQASDVGFKMRRIDKFTFVQGYTTQEAIINQVAASNGLTELWCDPGSDQCQFETLLFAYFFEASLSNVGGTGTASLQFGSGEQPSRFLEEGDEVDPAVEEKEMSVIVDDFWDYERRRLSNTKTFSVDIFSVQTIQRDEHREAVKESSASHFTLITSLFLSAILTYVLMDEKVG